jgi:hypothetical protein
MLLRQTINNLLHIGTNNIKNKMNNYGNKPKTVQLTEHTTKIPRLFSFVVIHSEIQIENGIHKMFNNI